MQNIISKFEPAKTNPGEAYTLSVVTRHPELFNRIPLSFTESLVESLASQNLDLNPITLRDFVWDFINSNSRVDYASSTKTVMFATAYGHIYGIEDVTTLSYLSLYIFCNKVNTTQDAWDVFVEQEMERFKSKAPAAANNSINRKSFRTGFVRVRADWHKEHLNPLDVCMAAACSHSNITHLLGNYQFMKPEGVVWTLKMPCELETEAKEEAKRQARLAIRPVKEEVVIQPIAKLSQEEMMDRRAGYLAMQRMMAAQQATRDLVLAETAALLRIGGKDEAYNLWKETNVEKRLEAVERAEQERAEHRLKADIEAAKQEAAERRRLAAAS